MPISRTETVLDELRRCGVLRPLDPVHFPDRVGGVVLTCGDGHQFRDLYQHHGRVLHSLSGDESCLQVVAANGGALSVPRDSPLHDIPFTRELLGFPSSGPLNEDQIELLQPARRDRAILHDVLASTVLKQVPIVSIYVHFPCAYAALAGLTYAEVIALGVKAKRLIKNLRPDLKVLLLAHVDWAHPDRGRVRATYHVSASEWIAWLSRRQRDSSADLVA